MTRNISLDMDHIRTVIPPYLRPFVLLSYPVPPPRRLLSFSSPTETLYGQGPEDLCFAAFAAIAFTVLREISLRYILSTIARLWLGSGHEGLKDERARRRARRRMRHVITRFAEQGWSFLYCTVFWTIGMVRPCRSSIYRHV
jgi:acyl-CoA-dependent ceramide synthase